MTNPKLFLKETMREFMRVNWPTREETVRYTLIVIGVSIAISAFLGALDFAFVQLLKKFILKQ